MYYLVKLYKYYKEKWNQNQIEIENDRMTQIIYRERRYRDRRYIEYPYYLSSLYPYYLSSLSVEELKIEEIKTEEIKRRIIKQGSVVKEAGPECVSECVICIEDYKSDNIIREINKCKHSFHVKCIDKWFEENDSCPECRYKISQTTQKMSRQAFMNETNVSDYWLY
jgi:hypothetical protein